MPLPYIGIESNQENATCSASPRKTTQLMTSCEHISVLGSSSPRSSPPRHAWWQHINYAPSLYLRVAMFLFLSGTVIMEVSNSNHHLRMILSNDDNRISSDESNDNDHKLLPSYSILPKKIYSVIGLESSGTQFVSKIIEDALKTGPYREGSRPCRETCHVGRANITNQCQVMKRISEAHACEEGSDVQVQHFSLPWGGSCHAHPNPPIVDVILPSECTRDQETPDEIEQCNTMTKDIWGFELNGKPMVYPIRYQLDITTNKRWYDAQGVEQYFIIVVRDDKISYTARREHCNNPERRKQEEEVGLELIVDAINTFILNDSDENVTSKTFDHWVAKQYQTTTDHRNNNHHGSFRRLSALPARNNVVVLSYESLIKLKSTYVRMLYHTLGIESDFSPDIRDSNEKYLNNTI
jgi:hypothetical protein